MLTAKKTLIVLFLLLAVSVFLGLYSATDVNDTGAEATSLGTNGNGLRGIYETLNALDMNAERSYVPPSAVVQGKNDICLVLWAPATKKTINELRHLEQLGQWVRAGGRLVIAPETVHGADREYSKEILIALGLDSLTFQTVTAPFVAGVKPKTTNERSKRKWSDEQGSPLQVPVSLKGEAASLLKGVKTLALPSQFVVTFGKSIQELSSDRIDFIDVRGREYTLAATLPVGRGHVVVVADPRVAMNKYLGFADNGLFVVRLLQGQSRMPVFDEFLHGVGFKGKLSYLFSKPPYSYLLILFVFITILIAWRSAVFLGPALPDEDGGRKGIAEYIQAIANLFLKKKAYKFSLQEIKAGTLRRLAQQYGVSPGKVSTEAIAKAMRKRKPQEAEKFTATMAVVDTLLSKQREPSMKTVIKITRELTQCR